MTDTSPSSVSNTTNVAAGTVGTVAVAKWALGCLIAHHLAMPDDTTLLVICGSLMPFGHIVYLGFAAWFTKKTGVALPPPPAA